VTISWKRGFAIADKSQAVNTARIFAKSMQADLKPIEEAEAYTTIALEGSIDMAGAWDIESKFLDYTSAQRRHVLVDMSAVDFLGSMGIRVFVRAAKALMREQKKLVLYATQPSVENTLALAGFMSVIPVVRTLEDAKAKIGM
jgi:anti-sigma B factor antagonist